MHWMLICFLVYNCWIIYNLYSYLREDSKGCVESCTNYKTAAGNPTYKQKDDMICIATCVVPTVINLA